MIKYGHCLLSWQMTSHLLVPVSFQGVFATAEIFCVWTCVCCPAHATLLYVNIFRQPIIICSWSYWLLWLSWRKAEKDKIRIELLEWKKIICNLFGVDMTNSECNLLAIDWLFCLFLFNPCRALRVWRRLILPWPSPLPATAISCRVTSDISTLGVTWTQATWQEPTQVTTIFSKHLMGYWMLCKTISSTSKPVIHSLSLLRV